MKRAARIGAIAGGVCSLLMLLVFISFDVEMKTGVYIYSAVLGFLIGFLFFVVFALLSLGRHYYEPQGYSPGS